MFTNEERMVIHQHLIGQILELMPYARNAEERFVYATHIGESASAIARLSWNG